MSRSSFSAEIAELICQRLAQGESLRSICASVEMPGHSTVLYWAANNPVFADQYARAREVGIELMAEQILAIADDPVGCLENGATDFGAVQKQRLQVDARKWLLAKQLPKKYGDRQAVELTGANGGPVEISDAERAAKVQAILAQAQRRADAQLAFGAMVGDVFKHGIVQTESGGQHFGKDGLPLQHVNSNGTSDWGIAQVNEKTAPEAAKLAGLPWDENRYKNDPQYNYALGMAAFQQQFQLHHGDLTKAIAAYNAPAALQKAVKEAAKKGNEGKSWQAFLPPAVQNYVQVSVANYNKAAGKPPREMTMADIEPHLEKLQLPPERLKIARNEAEYRLKNQNAALKQQSDQALSQAIEMMAQNKRTFNQLPEAVRNAVPTDKWATAYGVEDNLTKNKTNLALYNRLAANPLSNPETGQPMSDDEFMRFREGLSDTDFKHFADVRAKQQGKSQAANGAGDLNTEAINHTLNNFLVQLNIDPSPKSNDVKASGRVGAIRQFVDQYFYAAQQEAGKKFTAAEVNEHLTALFMKNVHIQNFMAKDYEGPVLGMDISDLNGATIKTIKQELKDNGIGAPTDAQILEHYWLGATKR